MTNSQVAKKTAVLLQSIAEPSRIRIISNLITGEKSVTELAKLLQAEIVNVSHHLGVLRQSGLVTDEKKGRFVIYSLNPKFFSSDGQTTYLNLAWCRIEIPTK